MKEPELAMNVLLVTNILKPDLGDVSFLEKNALEIKNLMMMFVMYIQRSYSILRKNVIKG